MEEAEAFLQAGEGRGRVLSPGEWSQGRRHSENGEDSERVREK